MPAPVDSNDPYPELVERTTSQFKKAIGTRGGALVHLAMLAEKGFNDGRNGLATLLGVLSTLGVPYDKNILDGTSHFAQLSDGGNPESAVRPFEWQAVPGMAEAPRTPLWGEALPYRMGGEYKLERVARRIGLKLLGRNHLKRAERALLKLAGHNNSLFLLLRRSAAWETQFDPAGRMSFTQRIGPLMRHFEIAYDPNARALTEVNAVSGLDLGWFKILKEGKSDLRIRTDSIYQRVPLKIYAGKRLLFNFGWLSLGFLTGGRLNEDTLRPEWHPFSGLADRMRGRAFLPRRVRRATN